jgi:hypothetical protein
MPVCRTHGRDTATSMTVVTSASGDTSVLLALAADDV